MMKRPSPAPSRADSEAVWQGPEDMGSSPPGFKSQEWVGGGVRHGSVAESLPGMRLPGFEIQDGGADQHCASLAGLSRVSERTGGCRLPGSIGSPLAV